MANRTKRIGTKGRMTGAIALAAGLAVGALPAGSALAQNALGDGRALDANLRQGSGGVNTPGRDFSSELALRNAIVTGNVGAGRSFRGDVGYAAADDFRGSLGSNDLFQFNREAAYSGLAAQNLRGIGALQFQLGQTTAGLTRGLGGDFIIRRAGTGLESGDVVGSPAARAPVTIDPFGHVSTSLRSTSDFLVRSSNFPRVLTTLESSQSSLTYLTASPLQGVKPMGVRNSALGLVLENEALAGEHQGQQIQGLPQDPLMERRLPGEEPREGASERERPTGTARPVTERLRSPTAHQSLLDEMRARQNVYKLEPEGRRVGEETHERESALERATERRGDAESRIETGDAERLRSRVDRPGEDQSEKSAVDVLNERLNELRREFVTAPEMPWQRDEREKDERRLDDRRKADLERLRENLDPDDPLAAANDIRRDDPAANPDDASFEGLIRRARETLGSSPAAIDTLIAEEGTSDLYVIHMRKGQEYLEKAQWFAAEERFGAALRARVSDPMAAAGRVSAEIGAGMYRSAATNLRQMLTAYPEMLQARLGPNLFPSGERLMRVRAQLRLRSELDTPVARDVGFLLAYVGAQSGNSQDVRDGFAIMDRVDTALKLEPEKLERVARALWAEQK